MKKTKILATLGPASIDKKIIKEMASVGLDAVRINTSHGDFKQYTEMIENVREVKDLPVMLDTEGPNVRVKAKKSLKIKSNDEVIMGFNGNSSKHAFAFNYNFFSKIKVNDSIFLNDGLLELKVKEKLNKALLLTASNSGLIYDGSGVNLPSVEVKLPILSEKDKKVLSFARKNSIDFIALSFTRKQKDIFTARKRLNDDSIGIVVKIESKEGVKNFDEILKVSDAVMIARGDLGVELPAEDVPLIQKELIQKTKQTGKIAIVATQMLNSMINNPRPTRAETSDVANAILDGADCVMLSNETTVGKYPIKAVKEMKRIALKVESTVRHRVENSKLKTVPDTISKSAYNIAKHLPVDKIIVITKTGFTARIISRFKPRQEILAVTDNVKIKRKLSMVYGVTPVLFEDMSEHEKILNTTKYCFDSALLNKNELILLAAGLYTEEPNISNLLELHKVKDLLKYYDKEFNLKVSKKKLVCSNCGIKIPMLYCCKQEMVLKNNRFVCEKCGKEISLSKAREIYEKSTERKVDLVKETLVSARKWLKSKKFHLPFKKEK